MEFPSQHPEGKFYFIWDSVTKVILLRVYFLCLCYHDVMFIYCVCVYM